MLPFVHKWKYKGKENKFCRQFSLARLFIVWYYSKTRSYERAVENLNSILCLRFETSRSSLPLLFSCNRTWRSLGATQPVLKNLPLPAGHQPPKIVFVLRWIAPVTSHNFRCNRRSNVAQFRTFFFFHPTVWRIFINAF